MESFRSSDVDDLILSCMSALLERSHLDSISSSCPPCPASTSQPLWVASWPHSPVVWIYSRTCGSAEPSSEKQRSSRVRKAGCREVCCSGPFKSVQSIIGASSSWGRDSPEEIVSLPPLPRHQPTLLIFLLSYSYCSSCFDTYSARHEPELDVHPLKRARCGWAIKRRESKVAITSLGDVRSRCSSCIETTAAETEGCHDTTPQSIDSDPGR